jgi:hypothetical protein
MRIERSMTVGATRLVAPITNQLRGRLLEYCRLYAYPQQPEPPPNGGFVILDSGAWGLSQSDQKIGIGWMRQLSVHYGKYCDTHVRFVAPDVYLDPYTTMRNWSWWRKNTSIPVIPVIQFEHEKRVDLYCAMKQLDFYAQYSPTWLAISNPGCWSIEVAATMGHVCSMARRITGAQWLHNLGAGWSNSDIQRWFDIGFNSIDSIAYYTDAKSGLLWRLGGDGKDQLVDFNWPDVAIQNFKVASQGRGYV